MSPRPKWTPNKGAAGNTVGRLAVCGVNRSRDRTVTPHASRFAGMSRASTWTSGPKAASCGPWEGMLDWRSLRQAYMTMPPSTASTCPVM